MKSPYTTFTDISSRLPVISILVAAISLLLYLCSDIGVFLQYDRALIANGELWRFITGHWTHWSFDHLLWCTITFIVLGSLCEQLNRRGYIISLLSSALIIPAVSWIVDPDMLFYRGLSGICSSVFIVGSVLMIRKSLADNNWINVILPAACGFLFFAKILYEFISGQAVFVQTNNIFSPVPLVHLVGGTIGLITVLLLTPQRNNENDTRQQTT